MSARVEALLKEVRRSLKSIEERLQPVPLCLSCRDAAKHLGVGVTKLKGLVDSRVLLTVKVGGRVMVPKAELDRIATPRAPVRTKSARSPLGRAHKRDPVDTKAWLRAQGKMRMAGEAAP